MARVLIVTGGFLSVKERSVRQALRRQIASHRASSAGWLDLQLKLLIAENLAVQQGLAHSPGFGRRPYASAVRRFFGTELQFETPELTEVSLMTLLDREGLEYEAATFVDLHADPRLRSRLLERCDVVFASSTLLRDVSELQPFVQMLAGERRKLVVGGALAPLVLDQLDQLDGVDVLAVGYGERLVPALARWIASEYRTLTAPPEGRVTQHGALTVLHAGVPEGKSLDHLPAPDWSLAERYHGTRYRMVHYESVRGCPYRCAFCNYPYLFDDTRFRMRSAGQIAEDWATLAESGAEYVTCLDSLFTMPERRLVALCEALLERDIRLKWIAYARADDLTDPAICRLMKRAGCHQVQIGVESGNQGQLDRMNKRCRVEDGLAALENCRDAEITTLVSMILGYPGETDQTLEDSARFVEQARPDFCYLSPFVTRIESVPVLSEESRARFGLETAGGIGSGAPYWRHDTMCSSEVGRRWSTFVHRMAETRSALDGGLFYKGILEYDRRDRGALLDFQRDFMATRRRLGFLSAPLHRFVQRRLERDVQRRFGPRRRHLPVMSPTVQL